VVTLGAPHRDQLAVHPLLWANLMTLAALGSLGVPGLMRFACDGSHECCRGYDQDVRAPLPSGVGAVSLFSRRDGVADWRACLDPDGINIEVESSHCGMASDPATLRATVRAVQRFESSPQRERSPRNGLRPWAVTAAHPVAQGNALGWTPHGQSLAPADARLCFCRAAYVSERLRYSSSRCARTPGRTACVADKHTGIAGPALIPGHRETSSCRGEIALHLGFPVHSAVNVDANGQPARAAGRNLRDDVDGA
jgi:hypothetical protein